MSHSFGNFTISSFIERKFALDGGSMFGVIPRVMWQKLMPVDENNYIPMVTRLYVVEADSVRYLIDTGLGDCLSESEQKIYATDNNSTMGSGLTGLGLVADDIDVVLLTHLHTDHSGGALVQTSGGFAPRFPNATYYVQKSELEVALNPDERSAAAYSVERTQALLDSGKLKVIDGATEIASGVKAVLTGGHTAGHQGFEFSSNSEIVANYCDILPFVHHLRLPFLAATDLYPLDTLRFKKPLIRRLIDENITLALAHDHEHILVKVKEDGRRIKTTDIAESAAEVSG